MPDIEGVFVKKLKVIIDERGRLMEMVRADDPFYSKFGQVYLTTNYPGVVKAWHHHKKQDDYVCCISGAIKLVLYDYRENSPTQGNLRELFIGPHNPCVVKIPKGVCHGWKGISETESIVINTVTELYNYQEPDEYRLPAHTNGVIKYDWGRQDG